MGGWYREFTPKVDRLPSRRRYDNYNGNVKVEREDEIHIGFPSGSQVEKCLSSLIARTQNKKCFEYERIRKLCQNSRH